MAQRVESNQAQPLLEMSGICKRFGATVALEDVAIKVAAGEVLALVGENGAGKSTLMKVLSGAITPDAGNMRLESEPYNPQNPLDARYAGVAMIYQELSLAPHLSVEENIVLGMEPAKFGMIRWKEVRKRAIEAISQFENPELTPQTRVNKLSVGSQQLVEIARAIAYGCRIIVLDEPTSSLTQQDVKRLFEIIGRLKKQGKAIIYISHFIEEVKQVSDNVTVLRDGRVVGAGQTASISTEKIIAMMVGRQVEQLYPRSPRTPGEVILEVEDLAGQDKLQSANIRLRRGEVFGIAGLVGAGRTELLRSIFGLDIVKKGKIRIGVYSGPASPVRRWEQGTGMLSEDRKEEGLASGLSIADNMTLSNLKDFGPMGLVFPGRQDRESRRWIDKLGIRCRSTRQPVVSLSGGNQQRVALARLLLHDVDVLLLDEPTRGIDVAAKAMIYKLIDDLASANVKGDAKPKAILMVSSYLPELMGVCDRVAVMCRGKLGPTYEIGQVNEHKLMLEATGQEIVN
jgi:ribose transport system ATP-binding protein